MTDTSNTAYANAGTSAPRVVVGVDGSAVGNDALRWAYAEAVLRNVPLHLVHCWDYPYYGTMDMVGLDDKIREATMVSAQALVDGLVARLRSEHSELEQPGGISVTSEVLQGAAGRTLLKYATDSDLLVVGSRGHGGFTGLLLGSVSHTVATHAEIPVVIVHHKKPND